MEIIGSDCSVVMFVVVLSLSAVFFYLGPDFEKFGSIHFKIYEKFILKKYSLITDDASCNESLKSWKKLY